MTTKQLIQSAIDLGDEHLETVYQILKRFIQSPRTNQLPLPLPWLEEIKRPAIHTKSRRSILELRGLGKHLWQDVSVTDYLKEERDSWAG